MPISHPFVSGKADGGDATLVRPSNWNASHAGTLDHGAELTGLEDDDHPQYLLVSGSRLMTGDLDMGGNDILSVRNMYPDPGGRLMLTAATPVMVADTAAQTTLYYALYKHDLVPLYDGTDWDVFRFTELSIAMAASANWATDSNFDCYVYNDAGTLRLVTGAAWTSGTARNESLTRVNGRRTNTASMTGRYGAASTVTVAANLGLYVGTLRTTSATGTTTWELGGTASGGDAGLLYLWNMYNRVDVSVTVKDSTDSWTYSTDAYRSKNASTTNRVTFLRGLNEDSVYASSGAHRQSNTVDGAGYESIGLDSTTAIAADASAGGAFALAANRFVQTVSRYAGFPGLGLHFLQAIETGDGTITELWVGDNGASRMVEGLHVQVKA